MASAARTWFQNNRRRISVVFLLVFAGGGIWFFSGRLPHDVVLRFELPPTAATADGPLTRADMRHLRGIVMDEEAAVVARFSVEQHWQGDAPLSKPVAVKLKRGSYRVEVVVAPDARRLDLRPPERGPDLSGTFEVQGPGEVRVDVRTVVR
jgi:hypothetical protein